MSKGMPIKPQFWIKPGVAGVLIGNGQYSNIPPISVISEEQFHYWYSKEIAPLFESAVEVGCAQDHYSRDWQAGTKYAPNKITHKALLVKIEPIKEESADDVLRELVKDYERIYGLTTGGVIEKAKAYLKKKDGK